MENTRNLMDFGIKQLHEAARLLSLLKTDKDITVKLGRHITPEYNPDSGLVFLISENFAIALINEDVCLEDWHRCDHCWSEGFAKNLKNAGECCQNYISRVVILS